MVPPSWVLGPPGFGAVWTRRQLDDVVDRFCKAGYCLCQYGLDVSNYCANIRVTVRSFIGVYVTYGFMEINEL